MHNDDDDALCAKSRANKLTGECELEPSITVGSSLTEDRRRRKWLARSANCGGFSLTFACQPATSRPTDREPAELEAGALCGPLRADRRN